MTDSARTGLLASLARLRASSTVATYLLRGASIDDAEASAITLDRQLAEQIRGDVLSYADAIASREFVAYDPSFQLASNQVFAAGVDDAPGVGALVDRLRAKGIGNDVARKDAPGVVAMAHRLEGASADDDVFVVRMTGAGIATKRANSVLALTPAEGVFSRVRAEIVYYEPRFEALVHGDDVIVSQATLLSRRFAAPAASERAASVFATATSGLRIAGGSDLAEAVASDPAMVAKMMALDRVMQSDADYREMLTMPRITAFLAENPHIGVDVRGAGDAAELVFDPSPQTRYRIPKLLADDYLSSTLSGRQYEAGSKQRLS
ncbi:hypothetical protein [Microbacterium indicum]|uniref:hypothetical protein n=1 Tax=Microbacterium indicum TaxID=358100 RepID=UPI0003F8495C|nr:hypothetical protein [Microbacterium indicum]